MPDLTKTKRLDELKDRFRAGARFTVAKMEEEFGITRRTANRDLRDLQEMGLDLRFEELPDGQRQWYASFRSREVLVRYSIGDILPLFLGRRMFDFLENTSLADGLERIYTRVETQLTRQKDLDNARKLSQKVYLVHEGPKKLPKRASEILDEVLSGLLYEHRVRLRYVNHRGEQSRLTICPYTLVAYKRGLYLLGAVDEKGGRITIYSLERIKSARWLRGDKFDYPAHHDPQKHFETALFIATGDPVTVELRFTPGTRPFIRIRKFHRTQRLKELEDGRIHMTLKLPINFEIINWILSFGANVEVVSPPELRDAVREELSRALGLYG